MWTQVETALGDHGGNTRPASCRGDDSQGEFLFHRSANNMQQG